MTNGGGNGGCDARGELHQLHNEKHGNRLRSAVAWCEYHGEGESSMLERVRVPRAEYIGQGKGSRDHVRGQSTLERGASAMGRVESTTTLVVRVQQEARTLWDERLQQR